MARLLGKAGAPSRLIGDGSGVPAPSLDAEVRDVQVDSSGRVVVCSFADGTRVDVRSWRGVDSRRLDAAERLMLICTASAMQRVLPAVLPARLPRDWTGVPDPMLLVATVSLLLLGAFVDMISDDVLAGQVASQGMSGGVYTTEERYREAPVLRGAAEPALPAGTNAGVQKTRTRSFAGALAK